MDPKFQTLVKKDKMDKRARDTARQRAPEHVMHPALAATYDKIAKENREGVVPKGYHRVSDDFTSVRVERETKGTFSYVANMRSREVMGKKVRAGRKGGYKVVPTLDQRFFDKIAEERAGKAPLREMVADLTAEFLAKGGKIQQV